jgi:uncharacterized protein (DUF433 family)
MEQPKSVGAGKAGEGIRPTQDQEASSEHPRGHSPEDAREGGSQMFDRITFDPQIMGGRACIRGMRIPVSVVVAQIAHGASFEEILEDYPDLEREDIQQAVGYAAWLAQEEVHTS